MKNPMDRDDVLRATLLAAAHAIDAALAYLGPQPADGACPHEHRTDLTTFAGERWICDDCGYEYQEADDAESDEP